MCKLEEGCEIGIAEPVEMVKSSEEIPDMEPMKLVESPLLGVSSPQGWRHNGEKFIVETDASIRGLDAVLSQVQPYGKLHPVGHALTPGERRITELETLTVVWTIGHF